MLQEMCKVRVLHKPAWETFEISVATLGVAFYEDIRAPVLHFSCNTRGGILHSVSWTLVASTTHHNSVNHPPEQQCATGPFRNSICAWAVLYAHLNRYEQHSRELRGDRTR
jgi:hypothetical protein